MNFKNIITNENMLKNLNDLGYIKATPIQEKALPHVLKKEDVLAKAKTGSGKTVAFGIPLLLELDDKKFFLTSSIVLAPTRELADQVSKELRKLAKFKNNIKILTLCGGTPMRGQSHSLSHGANIVVGTPGRILAHLKKGTLKIDNIKTLVLDEADRMLDMGFYDDIDEIISYAPSQKQTLLFSATFDQEILKLSKTMQNNQIQVEVEAEVSSIKERYFGFKNEALLSVIEHFKPKSCIIFANTKLKCGDIEAELQDKGYDALALHSDLEQLDRDETLIEFSHNSCTFLIATDVAARGLDIANVELVINYDMPKTKDIYTHRIGRTGRMDKEGLAISFVRGYENYIDVENLEGSDDLEITDHKPYSSGMKTLCIDGGKKDKIRAGDILGSLVKEVGVDPKAIGKITINPKDSYVSVNADIAEDVHKKLKNGRIKNKSLRVWMLS